MPRSRPLPATCGLLALAFSFACSGPAPSSGHSSTTRPTAFNRTPGHDRAASLVAATRPFATSSLSSDGSVRAFTMGAGSRVPRAKFFARHAGDLGLGASEAMVEQGSTDETFGREPRVGTRYRHVFKGVPVMGSDLILHEARDGVVAGEGHVVHGLDIDVVPDVAEPTARATALGEASHRGGGGARGRVIGDAQLAIVSTTADNSARGFRLAWQYTVRPKPTGAAYAVDIDAHSGAVLSALPMVDDLGAPWGAAAPRMASVGGGGIIYTPPPMADVGLTGVTLYDGTQSFTAAGAGGSPPFALSTVYRASYVRGVTVPALPAISVQCKTPNGTSPYWSTATVSTTSPVAFASTDLTCPTGAVGVETLWATEYVYNYWARTLGWSGIANDPQKINGATGENLLLVEDTTVASRMSYDYTSDTISIGTLNGKPMAVLDAIAHEMGHGMVHAVVGGSTSPKCTEWDSLNEGIADTLALAVKNTYRESIGEPAVWTLAEEILPGGVRNFQSPKLLSQPDTYQGQYYQTGQCTTSGGFDEHADAAILDHWFYLMVNGGTGSIDESTDPSQAYTVAPVSPTSASASLTLAAQLVQNALRSSTSGATFANFYTTTQYVAESMFGAGSASYDSVMDAWHAVGIGDKAETPYWHLPFTGESDVEAWPASFAWESDSTVSTAWSLEVAEEPGDLTLESGDTFQQFSASSPGDVAARTDDGHAIVAVTNINLAPQTTYYWRVRTTAPACLGGTTRGRCPANAWSPTFRFTTIRMAPTPITPAMGDAINPWTASFSWTAVEGASWYQLDLSDTGVFDDTTVFRSYELEPTDTPQATIPLLGLGHYAWRVTVYGPRIGLHSFQTDQSDTFLFSTTDLPAPEVSDWKDDDAWSFDFEVSDPGADHINVTCGTFTDVVPYPVGEFICASSALVPNPNAEVALFAVGPTPYDITSPADADQTAGPIGPMAAQTTATVHTAHPIDWTGTQPQLVVPGTWCASGLPIDFSWTLPPEAAESDGTTYDLQVQGATGAPQIVKKVPYFDQPLDDVCLPGSYSWSVQAFKGGDENSPGLPTTGSYTRTVDPPALLWPPDGATNIDPTIANTLTWTSTYAPEGYQFTISQNGAHFINGGGATAGYTLLPTSSSPLQAGTTYAWSVTATDPVSHQTAGSPVWTFTTLPKCADIQQAGGIAGDTRTIVLGKSSGTFSIAYQTYSIADRITVSYASGGATKTWTSGCVTTPDSCGNTCTPAQSEAADPWTASPEFTFDGSATAKVTVAAGCDAAMGDVSTTAWAYKVNCAQ